MKYGKKLIRFEIGTYIVITNYIINTLHYCCSVFDSVFHYLYRIIVFLYRVISFCFSYFALILYSWYSRRSADNEFDGLIFLYGWHIRKKTIISSINFHNVSYSFFFFAFSKLYYCYPVSGLNVPIQCDIVCKSVRNEN